MLHCLKSELRNYLLPMCNPWHPIPLRPFWSIYRQYIEEYIIDVSCVCTIVSKFTDISDPLMLWDSKQSRSIPESKTYRPGYKYVELGTHRQDLRRGGRAATDTVYEKIFLFICLAFYLGG